MTDRRIVSAVRPLLIAGSFAVVVATVIATAHTPPPAPAQTPAGPADLASIALGGRIESTTSVNVASNWVASNVIAKTRYPGWSADDPRVPQEIVFSFFNQQSALVASVAIDPKPKDELGAAKDVEVWISAQSPTAGFVKVAAATLKEESVEQPIVFTPVDAKFVKLRILSAHPRLINNQPAPVPVKLARVRMFEGQRAGYVSLLTRNPDLAALATGVIPQAPASAMGPPIPADGPGSCAVPVEVAKKSTFPMSQQVLVVADAPSSYTPQIWKPNDMNGTLDKTVYGKVAFRTVTPDVAAPVHLLSAPKVDTVVLAQLCEMDENVSKDFKQALVAWVAAGHKLILQDSDACTADPKTRSPRRVPDYRFLPFTFATSNPGSLGARGVAGILENNTLASATPQSPHFIDAIGWSKEANDLGDSNVVVEYDPHWCGSMWARNALKKSGFALAYARYGRGLIIYDGFDYDQSGNSVYARLITQELTQPFDADYLPCTQPLGGFIITADAALKSQPMVAGRTYAYPLTVLANFGYSGRVTLDASVVPADPGITVKLESAVADLTKVDESRASLTVTAAAGASLKSKVIAVRGRDAAGKSNVLCLALPERTTGSVMVVSGLVQGKKPTKNIEIILDASGSMKALLGAKTRWATAQAVLKDVVSKLPKDFSVGLRAYGHTLASTDPKTCTDSALVVPVAPLDPANVIGAAGKLAPRGETPLVYSILQTPADLKEVGGGTVILITDGEESCKGDFAAAAANLKASGLNLTLNIVGFTLKSVAAQTQLSGVAESTGGHYYGASSGDALARAVLLAAVDKLPYRILDAAGQEVAKGEAGVDRAHELPAGAYTVVITAAEQELRTPVTVAVAQDIVLKALIKGDRLIIEK